MRQAKLADKITVKHGVFEDVPAENGSFDVVWSQDAFLHSDQRDKVMAEAFRVLKPGGTLIFTDPMQADDVPEGVLQPVYDRLQLNSLGSPRFYREAAEALGFEHAGPGRHDPPAAHPLRAGARGAAGKLRQAARCGRVAEYLDKMAVGLENWVKAADAGHLAWGIQIFRKPA